MHPTVPASAAAAVAALPRASFDHAFQHLTAARLQVLENDLGLAASDAAVVLALLCLRRIAHRFLDKRNLFGDVGDAISQHGLGPTIENLRKQAGGSREALWRHLMAHPMTSYVPVQCQECGHQVPDETQPGSSDAEVGLSEDVPTDAEKPLVRSGWYRGPRGPVVFVIHCPACGASSRWFRSSAASVTLKPTRWGRLCGEQEDARTALASYLRIPLRVAFPLDWDHVWSEYQSDDCTTWKIYEGPGDAPAANFAKRLDEGIGAWTGVLAVGDDPQHCCDATKDYLACAPVGHVDGSLIAEIPRFAEQVNAARVDASGRETQSRSVNGYLIYVRAGFTPDQVTAVLQRAAEEHGERGWWEI